MACQAGAALAVAWTYNEGQGKLYKPEYRSADCFRAIVEFDVQITEKLLNEKVMALLKSRRACLDARSVMLELVSDENSLCNWRIGHFDPGEGDRYQCKVALRAIHEDLRDSYEMVGYS